jgi:hypothetical protein
MATSFTTWNSRAQCAHVNRPIKIESKRSPWGRSQIDRNEGTCTSFAFRDEARALPLDVHLHRVLRRADRVVHDVLLRLILRRIVFFRGSDAGVPRNCETLRMSTPALSSSTAAVFVEAMR